MKDDNVVFMTLFMTFLELGAILLAYVVAR